MFKKVKKGKKTMKKIKKLVAIQPVSFLEESKPLLNDYCDEVVFYDCLLYTSEFVHLFGFCFVLLFGSI